MVVVCFPWWLVVVAAAVAVAVVVFVVVWGWALIFQQLAAAFAVSAFAVASAVVVVVAGVQGYLHHLSPIPQHHCLALRCAACQRRLQQQPCRHCRRPHHRWLREMAGQNRVSHDACLVAALQSIVSC